MKLHYSLLLLVPAIIAYEGPPDNFLSDLNNLRRDYAKKYDVLYMHEMTWSEKLLNITKEYGPEEQTVWRYGLLKTFENAIDTIKSEIDEFMKKSDQEKEDLTMKKKGLALEFFVPHQRLIGCGSPSHQSDYRLCLMGPEHSLMAWKKSYFPESHCLPLDDYEIDDGLCVLKDANNKFIDGINEARKKYADKFNVPNMHKLTWNKELLGVLESLNLTNGMPTSTMNFRYWILPAFQYNSSSEFETSLENNYFSKHSNGRRNFLESGAETSLGALEFLIPRQKVIACAAKNVNTEYKKVCLIGPSGTPRMFATNTASVTRDLTQKLGCSANYKLEDGLCVSEDPENVSYFGNSEEFLNAVNAIRKKFANEEHIPNMHELTWKQSLATNADSLTWPDDSWTCARHVWRYVPTFYNGITEAIEEEVNYMLTELSNKEFLEFLKHGNESGHVGILELLNPLQTQIGCVSKQNVTDPFVLCLLGDEGVFKYWDSKSKQIPGSDCELGYIDQGGLCSLPVISNGLEINRKRKFASRDQNLDSVPRK